MLSIMLGLGVVSRLASGLIADRIGGVGTLILGSTLQCMALLFYLPFDGLTSLYVVSALRGADRPAWQHDRLKQLYRTVQEVLGRDPLLDGERSDVLDVRRQEALALLDDWWASGSCVPSPADDGAQ